MQYLNSRPLIAAYDGVVQYDHPSALADQLREGRLDVALCPSFELFAQPELYYVVDGAAIASRGPVYSVFLAYRGDLARVRKVALDPASQTSSQMARCLFERYHGREMKYVFEPEQADGRILIGNQAIRFRQTAGPEWRFLDFGEEWQRVTGLPFVFAVWLMREDTPSAREAAEELREIKRDGLANLKLIWESEGDFTAEFRQRYLTQFIHYELGAEEKGGLWEFGRALQELCLVPPTPVRPIFI